MLFDIARGLADVNAIDALERYILKRVAESAERIPRDEDY
jgi:hypothetical protein